MSAPCSNPLCDCQRCTWWRRGRDEERKIIVEELRRTGLGMLDDAKTSKTKDAPGFGGLLAKAATLAGTALGAVASGLADYYESGRHVEKYEERERAAGRMR